MNGKLSILKKKIRNLLEKEAWIITGKEKHTGDTFRIFFAGRLQNKYHIINLAFNPGYNETSLGRIKYLTLKRIVKSNKYDCSIAIVEGIQFDRFLYGSNNNFFAPLWLENTIDLPLKVTSKSLKEDIRRLKKNRLTYYVTDELEKVNDFYKNWYLPTIRNRHKKETFELPFSSVLKEIKEGNCKLLMSVIDGTEIAGVLLLFNNEIPTAWINGLRDDKYKKIRAIPATYYFSCLYLEEQGYKKFSLLNSRSFLNDGLLQYKRKWKPALSTNDTRGYIFIPLKESMAVSAFYLHNPFVYIKGSSFFGAVFKNEDDDINEEVYTTYRKKYLFTGLTALKIFSIVDSGIKGNKTKHFSFRKHTEITDF